MNTSVKQSWFTEHRGWEDFCSAGLGVLILLSPGLLSANVGTAIVISTGLTVPSQIYRKVRWSLVFGRTYAARAANCLKGERPFWPT